MSKQRILTDQEIANRYPLSFLPFSMVERVARVSYLDIDTYPSVVRSFDSALTMEMGTAESYVDDALTTAYLIFTKKK